MQETRNETLAYNTDERLCEWLRKKEQGGERERERERERGL